MEGLIDSLKKIVSVKEPWFVAKTEIFEPTKTVNIYIDLDYSKAEFKCDRCNKPSSIHDSNYFMWRHLSYEEYKCYFNVKIPRIICPKHGLHIMDKNRFRRMGASLSVNYSERLLLKGVPNEFKEFVVMS